MKKEYKGRNVTLRECSIYEDAENEPSMKQLKSCSCFEPFDCFVDCFYVKQIKISVHGNEEIFFICTVDQG